MGDVRAFLLSWEFEPTIILGIAIAAGLYIRGWRRLRKRGRGGRVLRPWRAWSFAGGLAAVALALLSPIATFDSIFFFMHMIQHVLLIMIAAPLIWLGAPMLPTLWAFDRRTRRQLGKLFRPDNPVHRVLHFLTRPSVALPLFVLVLLGWHFPPLYDAAQGRTLLHDLEHALFFATALLFWWPVIHPSGGKRRLSYAAAILYIFPAKLAGLVLGAGLSLARTPIYDFYARQPRVWGISALTDQQAGGLIMWVFVGVLFILPLFGLVLMMMREDEGDLWVPEVVRQAEADGRPGTVVPPRTGAGGIRPGSPTPEPGR